MRFQLWDCIVLDSLGHCRSQRIRDNLATSNLFPLGRIDCILEESGMLTARTHSHGSLQCPVRKRV